jgi:hypothetical protein
MTRLQLNYIAYIQYGKLYNELTKVEKDLLRY